MPRLPKKGLAYFPKDTNYYDDLKIIDLLNAKGPAGAIIYDALLCIIFKEGYYIEWPLEKVALILIRLIGNRWIKSSSWVLEVIHYCADIGLFDKDLLTQNVITSESIQRRYNEVTARNKTNKDKYWLLDDNKQPKESATKTPVSATKTPVSATEMQQTKENKTKQNNIINNISSERGEPAREPVIKLLLSNGSFYPIYDEDVAMWQDGYPAVNIKAELKKMNLWFDANPKKRKTQRGIRSCINSWMSRCQDRGGSSNYSASVKIPPNYNDATRYQDEKAGDISEF